jgi:hypothetical protein
VFDRSASFAERLKVFFTTPNPAFYCVCVRFLHHSALSGERCANGYASRMSRQGDPFWSIQ